MSPSDLQFQYNEKSHFFFFYRNRKVHPEIHMDSQGNWIAKKKNKVEGSALLDLKILQS